MIKASEIKKIVVGSTNPAKIKAVQVFFDHCFEHQYTISNANAPSGVSDQPLSEEETIQGAYNRCQWIMQHVADADIAIGLEGGVCFQKDFHGKEQCYLFGVVGILDTKGFFHYSMGGKITMPSIIAQELKNGAELGPLMDRLLSETNVKHKQGAVGVLTNNFIDRESGFSHNVATAFVPWIHPQWFVE